MSLRTPSFLAAKAKLRSLASPVLAVAIALFAGTSFAYLNVIWDPGHYGDFGLSMDGNNPDIVWQVLPGSPAARAGIRPGDHVVRPPTVHGRLEVYGPEAPYPGEQLGLSLVRDGAHRTVTLQARPLPALPVRDRILFLLKFVWLFTFLAMGLVLVLVRPNKMTWGFYLFAVNLVLIVGPNQLPRGPDSWIIAGSIFAHEIIAPAGVAGFLIFCVRFPANTSSGWRPTIERLAPYTAVIIAAHLLYGDAGYALFPRWSAGGCGELTIFTALLTAYFVTTVVLLKQRARQGERERREIVWVCAFLIVGMLATFHDVLLRDFIGPWSILFVFVLGTVVFVITFLDAHGLERHRIKWVVFGFACALFAIIVDFMWFGPVAPPWFVNVVELLYMAIPLTVAYAIIRHRVIDIRFAVTRTLTFTILASIIGLTFAGIDWLFSARLPSSRFEAAIYAGLALLIGFSLNAGRQRIGKAVDFVFFRQWYRAQEEANTIADTISHAASKFELHEPLTSGIADAFSLASTALFERIEDGGYVRVAAFGWPAGMTWHILPDDPLAKGADRNSRVLDLDTVVSNETDLPAGVARPTMLFPVTSAKRIAAILLCGAHENGTALASDEIRTIRRFCADAGLVYGSPARSLVRSLAAVEHGEELCV